MKLTRSRNDEGVTNVVSLIMIAAIIVSFMGMVFTTYLPAWGKDIEVQTLNDVMDSFMDLKSGMDTLSVGGDQGTSITTKFALGSEGGPMFGFGRMTGSITLDNEGGEMSVSDATTTYAQTRGTLSYSSYNVYVEEQDIILEGGAIFRDQAVSSVVKGPPNLLVDRDSATGSIKLYILLQNLQGTEIGFAGTGSYMVKTSLLTAEFSEYSLGGVDVTIEIATEHDGLWQDIVDDMMTEQGIPGTDYSTSYAGGVFSFTIDNVDNMSIRTSFFKIGVT